MEESIATMRQSNIAARNAVLQLTTLTDAIPTKAVNELGVIFLDTNTSKVVKTTSERGLVIALFSDEITIRRIAYCQLKRAPISMLSNRAQAALLIFQKDVTNRNLISDVAETLWLS